MKRGFKIFMALFMASAFAALSSAKITWHSDLDMLLKKSELEGKTVAFFIPSNGDKTLNCVPEFKDKEFLDFASGNVLFCKVNVSLSGKTFKFKDKKVGDFLSKFLKGDNVLWPDSYKMLLFKHPNRFCVFSGTVSGNALKKSSKAKSKPENKTNSDVSDPMNRPVMFSNLKNFANGTIGETFNETPGDIGAFEKKALYVMSPSVGELRELAEKNDKYIAFVISTNVNKAMKTELFGNEIFKNYAADNIIFVPVRKIYSQAAGKAKIVDAQYADFIASLGIAEVFRRGDAILFYHPKRQPFYGLVSDSPSMIRGECEFYKNGGRVMNAGRKSDANIKAQSEE